MADDKKTDKPEEVKNDEAAPKADEAMTETADAKENTKAEAAESADSKESANAKESTVELSGDAQKVMDMVEKMTVLELSELVKALEEKFGVSAAAPVMMAGGTAGAAAGEEAAPEEKSEYDVVLTAAGDTKIAVIKVVRELDQNLGLVEAKDLVESGDAVVLTGAKPEAAEEAKKKLEEAGGTVELR